ncbi:MAG TPA: hypothetical protein VM008_04270 [Phycisphaerae bacterium]|nr:hypothetical protein [Phycisphaerae bacterium]
MANSGAVMTVEPAVFPELAQPLSSIAPNVGFAARLTPERALGTLPGSKRSSVTKDSDMPKPRRRRKIGSKKRHQKWKARHHVQ